MPEFILDLGSPEHARAFGVLDEFTRGYIEAAFFTGIEDPADDTGCTDAEVGFSDLAPDALERIKSDCERFQADAAALLGLAYDRAGYDEERAGADFWFTRNHHGVGYWDRRELEAGDLGDKLTSAAQRFGETDLYVGDDGQVYDF